jgi:biopolymer transport protein TolR
MNLTPLIDVMLVLLIIFMVAAPLMTTGISLDLPRVGGKNMTGNDTSVNISVDRDGYYYIGDSEIPDGEMVEKLKAILGANNELTVTISGDTEANYGRVIGLMAILKEAGFEKVGLKTEAKPLGKKTK